MHTATFNLVCILLSGYQMVVHETICYQIIKEFSKMWPKSCNDRFH